MNNLKTNSEHQKEVQLIKNSQYFEKDILILWVNESTKGNPQWQFDVIPFALRHARRALFIIGSTNILRVCFSSCHFKFQLHCILIHFISIFFHDFISIIQFDPNWKNILQYARENDKEFDLNVANARPFYP